MQEVCVACCVSEWGVVVSRQVILNCSALPCLLHLLSSPKESIRKEACWTISNVTAGNRAQIQVSIAFYIGLQLGHSATVGSLG